MQTLSKYWCFHLKVYPDRGLVVAQAVWGLRQEEGAAKEIVFTNWATDGSRKQSAWAVGRHNNTQNMEKRRILHW